MSQQTERRIPVKVKRMARSVHAVKHDGVWYRVGDWVRVQWGGTDPTGTKRTTEGRIKKIMSDGRITIRRNGGRLDAHSRLDRVVEAVVRGLGEFRK